MTGLEGFTNRLVPNKYRQRRYDDDGVEDHDNAGVEDHGDDGVDVSSSV